jgi:DNA-binding NtrC family response regulator
MNAYGRVLIVDDQPSAIKVLSAILKEDSHTVLESKSAFNAIETLKTESIDAVITDLKMPGKDGYQLFEYVKEYYPDIPVIFLTAYGTVDSAVNALTNGAFYYFIKPPDYHKLKSILSRAIEQYRLKKELEELKKQVHEACPSYRMIGASEKMSRIFRTIKSVKDSESSILICGETGTGKELVARQLHYNSSRCDKPFIAFNCAAIPGDLIESELFGYEKGAFTGALTQRKGKFEEAEDGTIFLDEIGELSLPLQAKLLRVLQEREIERLGSNKKIKVNFRLITSTNRTLPDEILAGKFREDLFYRINVVQIDIPPLRERQEDIQLMISVFLKEFCLRESKVLTFPGEIMDAFLNYSWPGNVRQLRNVMERIVVLSRNNVITSADLPEEISDNFIKNEDTPHINTLKQMELNAVKIALETCNGNKSKAASQLGISRKTLYKLLRDNAII